MGIFKKKDKTETEEYKQQSKELEKGPQTEHIVVSQNPTDIQPKAEEISLEEAIINNTDTWYKAQVLGLLIEIRNAQTGRK